MFELFDRRCKSRDSIYHLTWFILPFHIIWLEFQLLILRFTDFRTELFARPTSATSESTLRVGVLCRSFYESLLKGCAAPFRISLATLSHPSCFKDTLSRCVVQNPRFHSLPSPAKLFLLFQSVSELLIVHKRNCWHYNVCFILEPIHINSGSTVFDSSSSKFAYVAFLFVSSAHKFAENLLHRLLGGFGAVKRKSRTPVIYAGGVRS